MGVRVAATSLLLSCAASSLIAQARPQPVTDSQTVVFVCEHGSVKSVVALAYFNQLVQQRHLSFRAISRGTAPDQSVPGMVREGLRKDGLPLGPFTPTRFTVADLTSAIAVISFDRPDVAGLVGEQVPTLRWDGLPSVSEDYPVARDAIRRRVARLVDSLERSGRGKASRPFR